ncbi:MAG: hypothetical protein FJY98_04045 [Candidatus Liptonbacteria bacterium]|nr:hypothetical protein [Candidatus Liptonbacteria bacterium]
MKRYGIFLCIIAITIGLAFLVREGYYPVAWVGGELLSAREFSSQFRAAKKYFINAAQVYGATSTPSTAGLEGAVLEGLIETSLIRAEVKKEIGDGAKDLIEERVEVFAKDEELIEAAKIIYGVSPEEFRAMVLVPQVEREILAGRLYLRGLEFSEWLDRAKREASIIMLTPGFEWTGKEIKKNP